MSKQGSLQISPDVLLYPLSFVLILWVVFWIEIRFGVRFTKWGIYPQEIKGLKGIITGPFVHGSLKHLFNNSIPLFVLSASLFFFYRKIRWQVLLIGMLLTGIATWLFARPSWHIGASGVVYLLASFLFFKGIFSRHFRLIALSLVVVFFYGSLIWYLFPIDPKISWEGHLSGFLVGLLLSLVFRKNPIEKPKYEWEKEDYNPEEDAFMKHFDEEGNFIPSTPEPVEESIPIHRPIKIVYTLSSKKKQEEE